jgi:hypothetical protein
MSAVLKVLAIFCLVEAGLSVVRHGWRSHEWVARLCFAAAFLLIEPIREGETAWTRLRRPRQVVALALATVAMAIIVLSTLAGRHA